MVLELDYTGPHTCEVALAYLSHLCVYLKSSCGCSFTSSLYFYYCTLAPPPRGLPSARDITRLAELGLGTCAVFFFFFFKRGFQLPRRRMMMAELVQGQASVAQPGATDDFADTIRRVRQVKICLCRFRVRCGWSQAGLGSGRSGSLSTNTPHAAS